MVPTFVLAMLFGGDTTTRRDTRKKNVIHNYLVRALRKKEVYCDPRTNNFAEAGHRKLRLEFSSKKRKETCCP